MSHQNLRLGKCWKLFWATLKWKDRKRRRLQFSSHTEYANRVVVEVCPRVKCSAARKFTNDDFSCTKVFAVSWATCLTDTDNFVSSIFQSGEHDPSSSDWLTFEWRFWGCVIMDNRRDMNNFLSSYTCPHCLLISYLKNAVASIYTGIWKILSSVHFLC